MSNTPLFWRVDLLRSSVPLILIVCTTVCDLGGSLCKIFLTALYVVGSTLVDPFLDSWKKAGSTPLLSEDAIITRLGLNASTMVSPHQQPRDRYGYEDVLNSGEFNG